MEHRSCQFFETKLGGSGLVLFYCWAVWRPCSVIRAMQKTFFKRGLMLKRGAILRTRVLYSSAIDSLVKDFNSFCCFSLARRGQRKDSVSCDMIGVDC